MSFFRVTKRNKEYVSRKVFADINVTPFVDVILVLLVVFMLVSSNMVSAVKLNLPKTNDKISSAGKLENVVISVNQYEELFFGEQKIFLYQIEELLRQKAKDIQQTIQIRGDKNLSYGFVMKIITKINSLGYSKVALVVQEN